jgi:hypothetical protein
MVRAWEVAFNGNVDAVHRSNPDNLSFISRYLDDSQIASSRVSQDISTAGGYNNWHLNVTQPARKVSNYSPTLTGKLYDFVNPDGSLFGRLFKQSQNDRLEYTFKLTRPDGNVIDINGNSGEIYQGFIEFEIYLPSDLQGKGIGKGLLKNKLSI